MKLQPLLKQEKFSDSSNTTGVSYDLGCKFNVLQLSKMWHEVQICAGSDAGVR